ncbi:MAG: hypothetical protein R3F54_01465 [Alphaproteobacteria bacterium]
MRRLATLAGVNAQILGSRPQSDRSPPRSARIRMTAQAAAPGYRFCTDFFQTPLIAPFGSMPLNSTGSALSSDAKTATLPQPTSLFPIGANNPNSPEPPPKRGKGQKGGISSADLGRRLGVREATA